MPNPTQSDLHINVPLSNISVAYMQDTDMYIADKVFPRVPVSKQSDLYWKYLKSEWRRTDVQKRAPGTESKGVGWNVDYDQYRCDVYAIHQDIDDQVRANADSPFNLDRDATKFVTNQLLLKRDQDWVNAYFKPGVWSTDVSGVGAGAGTDQTLQWDQAGSDPINDVAEAMLIVEEQTGYKPNTMVVSPYVIKELKSHPDILDRIKYTQRGVVTEELLASLFGVDKMLVSRASQTTVNRHIVPTDTEEAAEGSYAFMAGKNALLVYSPSSPSLMQPAAGYTFTWNGYAAGNDRGLRMKRFRMEPINSDRIEGEMSYDMKVVAPDVGYYFDSIVA